MGVLSESLYSMQFDAASLRRMATMVNALPIFERYYLAAMRYSVNLVASRATQNAPVLYGHLHRSIRGFPLTPYLGKAGVLATVPYARRREFGFDNRTDRLGRHYALDPKDAEKRAHMYYLHRALDESRPEIAIAYRTAVQLSIREIAL